MEKVIRTIVLPGYSLHNKVWALDIEKALTKDKIKVTVYEWTHWKRGFFDLESEVGKIFEIISREKINIIAKSVGTRVAVEILTQIPQKINKLILCGIPFRGMHDGAKNYFKESLKYYNPKNIIIFQNTQDPFGSYKLIRDFVWEINPEIEVVEMPRRDHNYPYPIDFSGFLNNN